MIVNRLQISIFPTYYQLHTILPRNGFAFNDAFCFLLGMSEVNYLTKIPISFEQNVLFSNFFHRVIAAFLIRSKRRAHFFNYTVWFWMIYLGQWNKSQLIVHQSKEHMHLHLLLPGTIDELKEHVMKEVSQIVTNSSWAH